MSNIDFLLVTCSMEQSRFEILKKVVDNLKKEAPEILEKICVFDNASKIIETQKLLKDNFSNVYISNKNVGYWSAINWWLKNIQTKKYTYIIESDMMHYNFSKLYNCEKYLDMFDDIGSVRLHEYDVNLKHLYNKDKPVRDSRKNIWQSHTNKKTNKPIEFIDSISIYDSVLWKTTFLTQLVSLNRSSTIKNCFESLSKLDKFSELDFQKLYWDHYNYTGILDKGIFNVDDACWGTSNITGSWTSKDVLEKIGYQETRNSKIVNLNEFLVTKIS